MTTRPGYAWDSATNEWIQIGPVANVGSTVYYQASEPTGAGTGDLWIDADDDVPGITSTLNYRWRKIATGGETTLSGSDSAGLPLAYNPGYEQLFINGVLQYRGSDYTATTGTSINGLTALVAGDVVEVLSFVTSPIGDTYTQAVADAKFQTKIATGLVQVVPTSVSVGSGTGSVTSNGAVSFNSASSITINNCFNSSYDNYIAEIWISATASTTSSTGLLVQLTSSGTPNAGNYYWSYSGNTGGGVILNNGTAAGSNFQYAHDVSGRISSELLFTYPYAQTETRMISRTNYQVTSTGHTGNTTGGCGHYTGGQFDGFKFMLSVGIMNGTIRIYGYNNGA